MALPSAPRRGRALPAFARLLNTFPSPGARLRSRACPAPATRRSSPRSRGGRASALLRRRRGNAARRRALARGSRVAARGAASRSRCIRRAKDSARPSRTSKSRASASRRWSGLRAAGCACSSPPRARCSSARGCRARFGRRGSSCARATRGASRSCVAPRAHRLRARADGRGRRAVQRARRNLRHLRLRHGRAGAPGVLGRR